MKVFPKILPMGERSILIEFDSNYNTESLKKLLAVKKTLYHKKLKGVVEITNTYRSILISYRYVIENIYSELSQVKQLISTANIEKNNSCKIFNIPVCYDLEFGLDLEHISIENQLEIERIIELHTAPLYTVYFIGFLPGFLYLGGLDKRLQIPRKKTPRQSIENGAVGIGENQTGIYPKKSPGGWQILGRSPVKIFDKNSTPPCKISSGDKIQFYSISKMEFFRIQNEVELGKYHLKFESYES